jgi:hypothetical protein
LLKKYLRGRAGELASDIDMNEFVYSIQNEEFQRKTTLIFIRII